MVISTMFNGHVEEFRKRRPLYELYTDKIKTLISELVIHHATSVHVIEARTKTIDSFSDKISRPAKTYDKPLDEIRDISGLRLIVYYGDDVSNIVSIIKKEFIIVEEEVKPDEEDRFGYRSVHLIAKLRPDRAALFEWQKFGALVFEIQVRTVLQHAWAAVSHVLHYKNTPNVPAQLRRRMSRLAGLFELADEEFIGIRTDHARSSEATKQAILKGDRNIKLNIEGVQELITSSKRLKSALEFAQSLGFILSTSQENNHNTVLGILKQADAAGIVTLEELDGAIDVKYEDYLVILWNDFDNERDATSWAISHEFILYLLLIRYRIDKFTEGMLVSDGWSRGIAKRVLAGARKHANMSSRT